MTDVPGGWQDLELDAPEIARLGMDRINAAHIALLGTLRRDGSHRISPIEPYFAGASCSWVSCGEAVEGGVVGAGRGA